MEKMESIKVKAIKRGYDGVQVREVGEVFEFKGKLGSWMKEASKGDEAFESKVEKKPGAQAKGPQKPADKSVI
jgi:hypothetical protein